MKQDSAFHAVDAPERPTHDQIAAKAYELYLKTGREDGHSVENWLRAEQSLIQERARTAIGQIKPNEAQERPPVDFRQQPYARDERRSATREEIRRETSPMRPPSRQSLRRPERSRQTR
jgi:hypothetical protein